MSVLVTGGAGYIGSHTCHALVDQGENVVVIDNLSTGFDWAVPPAAELVIGDIADQKLIEKLIAAHGITAIIHFAGSIVVPESVAEPLAYYHNNTAKTRDLLEVAVLAKVKHFIFSSTAAVYGMPKVNPVTEEAPFAPISPYGSSKMMTEIMLKDTAAAKDLNYVALRYFNVAGADPAGRTGQSTPNATHLIKIAAEIVHGPRTQMSIFGDDYPTRDGTCIRDYIHVSDLAKAHCSALDYLRNGGESRVFNCGYGKGFSVLEVIEAVRKASGQNFPAHMTERRPGDPAELIAGAARIRQELGWQPDYQNLETIVTHALAWEARLSEMKKVS